MVPQMQAVSPEVQIHKKKRNDTDPKLAKKPLNQPRTRLILLLQNDGNTEHEMNRTPLFFLSPVNPFPPERLCEEPPSPTQSFPHARQQNNPLVTHECGWCTELAHGLLDELDVVLLPVCQLQHRARQHARPLRAELQEVVENGIE